MQMMSHFTASIRTLFLDPRSSYEVPLAASILAMDEADVHSWIDSGEVEAVDTREGIRIPWTELVVLAMEVVGQQSIEEALGRDVDRALPELVRLAELRVRIPRYEIAALEQIAERNGTTVADLVAWELLEPVWANMEWLACAIPSFEEACRWPEA